MVKDHIKRLRQAAILEPIPRDDDKSVVHVGIVDLRKMLREYDDLSRVYEAIRYFVPEFSLDVDHLGRTVRFSVLVPLKESDMEGLDARTIAKVVAGQFEEKIERMIIQHREMFDKDERDRRCK